MFPRRIPVPRVSTDEVLVAHAFDDSRSVRNLIIGLGFRFGHVLDCDKVHSALDCLLAKEGWRRLGGRLRLNETGRIEILVPNRFTPERPAVRYTHVTHDMNIEEHPQIRDHFPRPTDGPSIQSSYEEYMSLSEPNESLHSLEDYLRSDHPQISLHTVSFRDATLVSLKIPHLTTDIMGWHNLLQNWSLVVSGREDQVRPFAGFRDDILERVAELGKPSKSEESSDTSSSLQEFKLAGHKQLKGLGMFLFAVRFLWALFFGTKTLQRDVFLSAKTMQALRDEVKMDLGRHLAKEGSEVPFISDADILTAWCAKMTLSGMRLTFPSRRKAAIMTTVDIRKRLPSIFRPDPTQTPEREPVYIQNLTSQAMTHLPVQRILTQPLGITALQIHESVHGQFSEEVISGYTRHMLAAPGRSALFMTGDSVLLPVSNWTCARLWDVFDLSGAIVSKSASTGGSRPYERRPVKAVAIGPVMFSRNPEIRNAWGVTGRDAEGNCWLQASCTEATWRAIENEFERLGRLSG
ncbi:hypothetical protein V8F20_009594 [Naviculisporaceae sp. PSN 640]